MSRQLIVVCKIAARVVSAACALGLSHSIAVAQVAVERTHPLEIADALGALAVNGRMPVLLSPDGQLVAYTVYDARRRRSPGDDRYTYFTPTGAFSEAVGCQVWLTDTKSGITTKLGDSASTSSNPVWSPDGKWLAFYSDRGGTYRLWLWRRATRTAMRFPA